MQNAHALQAMGMDVTVISTSARKEKEAREVLGADHFIISKDEKQMQVGNRKHGNRGDGNSMKLQRNLRIFQQKMCYWSSASGSRLS